MVGESEVAEVLEPLEREIRLAVVMYGGVSLAIYINGVAQELLSLVRATARESLDPLVPSGLLHLAEELGGAELVYRRLARLISGGPDAPVRVRFVVDVLSGTSAGGLNAIFLAKALVHEANLEELRRIWVDEGDFAKLINDPRSLEGLPPPPLPTIGSPKSLLNSSRMLRLIRTALDKFDQTPMPAPRSRYVGELDLRVTATDLEGLTAPLPFDGGATPSALERRHTKIFHFRHQDGETLPNGFGEENTPFLAYVARSTSAFPFALEPMQLADVGEALDDWPRSFYPEYPSDGIPPFAQRAFSDGGILDNKPFTDITKDLRRRGAPVRVDRKLVYIEPSPEQFGPELTAVPNALATAKAALLSIPRYETIREDLDALVERNALIERTVDSIRIADEAQLPVSQIIFEDSAWDEVSPEANTALYGPGYPVYARLRILSTSDELATLIAEARGLAHRPEAIRAIARLVLTWVDMRAPNVEPARSLFLRRFLRKYDLPYRLRRVEFLLQRVGQIQRGDPAVAPLLGLAVEEIDWEKAAAAVAPLRDSASQALRLLVDARREIVANDAFRAVVTESELTSEQLEVLLEPKPDAGALEAVVGAAGEPMEVGAAVIAAAIGDAAQPAGTTNLTAARADALVSAAVFEAAQGTGASTSARAAVFLSALSYQSYEAYDSIVLPLTFGTSIGEAGPIELTRISPEDARALREGLPLKSPLGRLAGDTLNHFGAFLEEPWRKHDLLWGRLDGAEQLIELLARGTAAEDNVPELVAEAHSAILAQEGEGSIEQFIASYGLDPADGTRGLETLRRSSSTTAGILAPIASGENPGPVRKLAAALAIMLWRLLFWAPARSVIPALALVLGVNLALLGRRHDASWLVLFGIEVALAGCLIGAVVWLAHGWLTRFLARKIALPAPPQADN